MSTLLSFFELFSNEFLCQLWIFTRTAVLKPFLFAYPHGEKRKLRVPYKAVIPNRGTAAHYCRAEVSGVLPNLKLLPFH